MATYQKRGTSWRAIIRRQGQTTSATFDSRSEAEQWATKTEARILLGEPPEQAVAAVKAEGLTVIQLFDRYADEVSILKRGERWERIRLAMLGRRFSVFAKVATTVTGPDMADWRDARLKECSGSSVSRELNLISAVFTHAIKEWRVGLAGNPVHLITWPRQNKARTQRVDSKARSRLVAALEWDGVSQPTRSTHWAAYAFVLALETAMRKSEILRIQWKHVHLGDSYIHLPLTKNGDERDVPLSSAAIAHIRLLTAGDADDRLVPIDSGNLDKLIREARQDTGLMHVRFHDCRRECATVMSTKLANVLELAALTGHRSLQTLKIYYRPKASDIAAKLG